MIRRLRIANFKSARDQVELELGPLTLLTGANSSGKSTIVQALLVLTQTASSRSDERKLILNGGLTRLGAFSDVLSHDAKSRVIKFGFDIDISSSTAAGLSHRRIRYSTLRNFTPLARRNVAVALDVDFSLPARARPQESLGGQVDRRIRLESSKIQLFSDAPESPRFYVNAKRSPSTSAARARSLNLRTPAEVTRDVPGLDMTVTFDRQSRKSALESDPSGSKISGIVGVSMLHFLPQHLLLKVDARDAIFQDLEAQLEGDAESGYIAPDGREVPVPGPLVKVLSSIADATNGKSAEKFKLNLSNAAWLERWRMWISNLEDSDRATLHRKIQSHQKALVDAVVDSKPAYDLQLRLLPSPAREAVQHIESFLRSQVQYIGPLRHAPSPNHPLSPSEELSKVGTQGQHTAAVLYNFKNRKVISSSLSDTPGESTLQAEVGAWLENLGLGSGVATRDLGNMGYELKVIDTRGDAHDLTQLGVGVSQVLPILVAGLLAKPGDVLLLEQPELHLNPRVQTRLADFLIWLTQNGVQCIVETHSEHMINRLRRRHAETDSGAPLPKSVIYFVEQENGTSTYRRMDINDHGGISGWPKGFFDDSQLESRAILSAVASKRKKSIDA